MSTFGDDADASGFGKRSAREAAEQQLKEKDDGGPAFPSRPPMGRVSGGSGEPIRVDLVRSDFDGMSLRDWFAGQALAGMNASLTTSTSWPSDGEANLMAASAYQQADAMLAVRKLE